MSKQKLRSPPRSCLTDATDAFMRPEGDTSITLRAPAASASLPKPQSAGAGGRQRARGCGQADTSPRLWAQT